jgi:broad specificity phosphatase PhoE
MFDIKEIMPTVLCGLPMAVFIRHAEKAPLADLGHDEFRDLTYVGQRDTHLLTDWLQQQQKVPTKIFTSPVLRCVRTAEIISEKFESKIFTSDLLGAPGAYIQTPALAEKIFAQYSVKDIIHRLLRQEDVLSGFYDLKVGSERLLQQVVYELGNIDRTMNLLYVSHDTILVPFLYYLLKQNDTHDHWIDYLQGFIIQLIDRETLMIYFSSTLKISMTF